MNTHSNAPDDPSTADSANLSALTQLLKSVRAGEVDEVTQRLDRMPAQERAALLAQRDAVGATLLHAAAAENQAQLCTRLAQWGADLQAVDRDGQSPLHWAASRDAGRACAALIEAGAHIDLPDIHQETPLFKAVFASSGQSMMHLLDAGANRKQANALGVEPMAWIDHHPELRDVFMAWSAKQAIRSAITQQVAP